MMPKIICGSSVGSIIASCVSVLNKDELLLTQSYDVIWRDKVVEWNGDSPAEIFTSWLEKGALLSVDVLKSFIRNIVEDLTFEEIYQQNGRILNITISDGRF